MDQDTQHRNISGIERRVHLGLEVKSQVERQGMQSPQPQSAPDLPVLLNNTTGEHKIQHRQACLRRVIASEGQKDRKVNSLNLDGAGPIHEGVAEADEVVDGLQVLGQADTNTPSGELGKKVVPQVGEGLRGDVQDVVSRVVIVNLQPGPGKHDIKTPIVETQMNPRRLRRPLDKLVGETTPGPEKQRL